MSKEITKLNRLYKLNIVLLIIWILFFAFDVVLFCVTLKSMWVIPSVMLLVAIGFTIATLRMNRRVFAAVQKFEELDKQPHNM